jgi:phosphonate transport system permease protein
MGSLAPAGGEDRLSAIERFETERRGRLIRSRLIHLAWVLGFSGLFVWSLHISDFFAGQGGGDPLARIGQFLSRMTPDLEAGVLFEDRRTEGSLAYWYYDLPLWLDRAWETIQMAVVGTAAGAAVAVCLALLAARNLMPLGAVRFVVRRWFEVLRTIPDILLAILLTAAFGIGPMAGVLTLLISTTGSLGKLFTEAFESADARPVEAVRASGGGWVAEVRYGVLPQVAPALVSYALLRLEINLAAAAALGIVGAGGIGVELERTITYSEYDTYFAILLIIIGMIFLIDMGSEYIRHRLIGIGGRR